jgi:hypothetical protein
MRSNDHSDDPALFSNDEAVTTLDDEDEDQGRGRQRLSELFGADGPPDLDTIAAPLFWPSIPATDISAEWAALRAWVEALVARYPHLDHHVIPRCWWQHPGHVEALQALRDHERVSFAPSAAATAATDWQWRLALIEGRLREWTAHAGCSSSHREPATGLTQPDPTLWDAMIAADEHDRSAREIADEVPAPGVHR